MITDILEQKPVSSYVEIAVEIMQECYRNAWIK